MLNAKQVHERVLDSYTALHGLLHPRPAPDAQLQLVELAETFAAKSDWVHLVYALPGVGEWLGVVSSVKSLTVHRDEFIEAARADRPDIGGGAGSRHRPLQPARRFSGLSSGADPIALPSDGRNADVALDIPKLLPDGRPWRLRSWRIGTCVYLCGVVTWCSRLDSRSARFDGQLLLVAPGPTARSLLLLYLTHLIIV